jgi:hypothetical protein
VKAANRESYAVYQVSEFASLVSTVEWVSPDKVEDTDVPLSLIETGFGVRAHTAASTEAHTVKSAAPELCERQGSQLAKLVALAASMLRIPSLTADQRDGQRNLSELFVDTAEDHQRT